MANVHLLSAPASDAGAYSGGSWVTTLPLANVLTRPPRQVARTTDATAASTQFTVDLGASRPIGLFALIGHNCSATATVRYRVSDAADGSSPGLDVTQAARRPNVVWGSRAWGDLPWDGYEAGVEPGGSIAFLRPAASVIGRYLFVDIADAGNPAGYVEIGRVMIGMPFVPRFNFTTGATFALIDESRLSRSIGGQLWTDARPQRRKLSLSFDFASEAAAYGAVYDMQRRAGLTGPVLAVYDPDDADGTAARRTVYGTLPSLGGIVTVNASVDAPYQWTFEIEELI